MGGGTKASVFMHQVVDNTKIIDFHMVIIPTMSIYLEYSEGCGVTFTSLVLVPSTVGMYNFQEKGGWEKA